MKLSLACSTDIERFRNVFASENMFLFRCIGTLFSCNKSRLGDMTHLHKSVNTRAAKLLWRGAQSLLRPKLLHVRKLVSWNNSTRYIRLLCGLFIVKTLLLTIFRPANYYSLVTL